MSWDNHAILVFRKQQVRGSGIPPPVPEKLGFYPRFPSGDRQVLLRGSWTGTDEDWLVGTHGMRTPTRLRAPEQPVRARHAGMSWDVSCCCCLVMCINAATARAEL